MTQKRSIHAGHRARMRERARQEGLDAFSEHEVLELLLTYAIPRRNVNQLAHALIETFGSLSAVLEADGRELMRVAGMGEQAATLLTLMPQFMRYYQMNAQGKRPVILNLAQARAYCAPLFLGLGEERIYMVCLSRAGAVLHRALLHTGTVEQVPLSPRTVVEAALRHKAYCVLLAHNHPSGTVEPSDEDAELTRAISTALYLIGVQRVDHLIFAHAQAYSMAHGRCLHAQAEAEPASYVSSAGAQAGSLREAAYQWIGLAHDTP